MILQKDLCVDLFRQAGKTITILGKRLTKSAFRAAFSTVL